MSSVDKTNEQLVQELAEMHQRVTELETSEAELKQAETTLQKEKAFIEHMLDAIVDTVFVFDPSAGKPVKWNSAFNKVSGYTDEEIASMKAPDAWYNEADLEKAQTATETLLEGEQAVVEMSLITKDGKLIPTEYTASMLRDSEGNLRYIIATGRDIAERKQAEDALRESEERYRRLVELSPDMIAIHQDGKVRFINRAGARMLGASAPEEIIGKPIQEFVSPRKRALSQQRVQKLLQNGECSPIYEQKLVRLDGQGVDVEVVGIPFTYQDKTAIQLIARDITERKHTEEALHESEKRYRIISELISDYAFGADIEPDGTLIKRWATEDSYTRLTGYKWGEASPYAHYHPDDVETAKRLVEETLQGKPTQGEHRTITKDGDTRWIHIRRYVEWDPEENRAVRLYAAAQDITERKRAEEALRQSEARYRAIVQDQTELISRFSLDYTLTFVNDAYCRYFGKAREALLGTRILSSVPGEDSEEVIAHLAALTPENPTGIIENRNLVSGEMRWQQWTMRAIYDEQERLVEFQTVGRDITERKRREAALVDEHDLLRTVLDHMPAQIAVKDTESRLILVNAEAMRFWGWATPNDYLGKTDYDIQSPERAALLYAEEQEILRYNQSKFQTERQDRPGEWLFVTKVPFYDNQGNVIGLVCFNVDISERKRMEEALRESEAMLQRILQAAPVGIGFTKEWVFQWVNEASQSILGYSHEEVVGKDTRFLYPDDEEYERAGEETNQQLRDHGVTNVETRFQCKDGTLIDVVLSTTHLDPANPAVGQITTVLDITERKRTEEERARLAAQVREQARRMEQILTTVPAGVLLLDAEGRILQANPVAEGDLIVLAGAKVGHVLTHLGDRPLAELLTSPPTKGLWHEVKAENRTFEAITRPVENGPEPKHWVLVINDVTREREIRLQLQQQERLAAVGQLAAGIAHDFNNVMAAVVLYAQMAARSEELSERNRERMAVISQQAWHATRLIEQILDFSRRAVLERRPFDLLPLMKEQVKLLKRTLPEHIRIHLDYDADEYMVHADPTRIQQTIMNLAVNARDAMPEGGELRIGLTRVRFERDRDIPLPDMEAGEWVQIALADTGTGIAPEVLPHIFEPFFTTKAPEQGSGLGLAQVYGIVKQHGGHIDVTTEVGKGTTFILYLPALVTPQTETLTLDAETLIEGEGEIVLVVEDDRVSMEAVADGLVSLGYRVLSAHNGREALEVVDQHGDEIALVLSDVVMPEMGGVALFHALKGRGLTMRVILMTGHPLDAELGGLQEQGLAGWIAKPLTLEEISRVVAQALGKA